MDAASPIIYVVSCSFSLTSYFLFKVIYIFFLLLKFLLTFKYHGKLETNLFGFPQYFKTLVIFIFLLSIDVSRYSQLRYSTSLLMQTHNLKFPMARRS